MTGIGDWQGRTGEGWAAQWQRTDRSFGAVTDKLLARSEEFSFRQILDVGCGAGELSLALGRRHPDAQVVGVDVSPPLVSVANRRGANQANVRFDLADAAEWQPPNDFAPQLLISRHGVMFFDDPPAAFANLAAAADDKAKLLFSCFRDRHESPFFNEIGALLPASADSPDPYAPGPFAFADPDRVARILLEGGWDKPTLEPFDFAMVAGAGVDAIDDAMTYFQTIGPAAVALREMPEADRPGVLEGIREVVSANCRDGVVALRAACWIVTATKT